MAAKKLKSVAALEMADCSKTIIQVLFQATGRLRQVPSKMALRNRRYSIGTSPYYVQPVFDGLTVRQKVQLLETLLPVITTQDEAVKRAQTGLYAVGKMSCMLMESLWEQQDFSGKTALVFWAEVAIDCERHFQGNITSALAHKLKEQRRLGRQAEEKKLKGELAALLAQSEWGIKWEELEWELDEAEDRVGYLKKLIAEFHEMEAEAPKPAGAPTQLMAF